VLLTRSPLEHPPKRAFPHDLHVLSTPPAFVLSQDQTLQQGPHQQPHTHPTPKTQTSESRTRNNGPPAKTKKMENNPIHPPTQAPELGEAETQTLGREGTKTTKGTTTTNPHPQPPPHTTHTRRSKGQRKNQENAAQEPKKALGSSFTHAVEFSKNGHPPPEPTPTRRPQPRQPNYTTRIFISVKWIRRTETLSRLSPAHRATIDSDQLDGVPQAGRRLGVLHPVWAVHSSLHRSR
jgi:hypothetical protein